MENIFFLPPELWDLIIQKININIVAKLKLLYKFFNELILNNKILKYNLILSSGNQYIKKPTDQFIWACKEGKIELVKWLFNIYSDKIPELSPTFAIPDVWYDDNITIVKALESACGEEYFPCKESENISRLETVKWLVNTYIYSNTVIYSGDLCPFQRACINGNLEIAKLLFKTFLIPSYSIDEKFIDSDDEDNEELVAEQEITDTNRDIFIESCCIKNWPEIPSPSRIKAQLEVVKWLIEKFEIKSEMSRVDIINILVSSWSNIKCYIPIDIVRFLIENFELTATEIGLDYNPDIFPFLYRNVLNLSPRFPFQEACTSGHLNLVKWLVEWYIEEGELKAVNYPSENYTVKVHQKVIEYICEALKRSFSSDRDSLKLKKIKTETAKYLIETFNITIEDLRGKNFRKLEIPRYNSRLVPCNDIVRLAWVTGHGEFVTWIAKKVGYAILDNFNVDLIEAIRKGPEM